LSSCSGRRKGRKNKFCLHTVRSHSILLLFPAVSQLRDDKPEDVDSEMALIKCPDCGKEITDKATNCVHCGCPINIPKSSHDDENVNTQSSEEIKSDESNESQALSALKAFVTGSLRKCPSCGQSIAQNAKRCPYCGRREPFFFSHMIYYILVIIMLIAYFSALGGKGK